MARTIYVTSGEPESGKSLVVLGLLDLMARTTHRVGVFRPVARSTQIRDWVLELALSHEAVDVSYTDAVGVAYDDVIADPEAAMSTIVRRFHAIERNYEAIIVIGTDYTDVLGPTELGFNARIAANIGAPVVLVVPGDKHTPLEVRQAAAVAVVELEAHQAQPVGIVATKVNPEMLDQVRDVLTGPAPVWVIPADMILYAPTLQQVSESLGGKLLWGDEALLDREVFLIKVAAMTLEHVLPRISDGAVVITPGDRTDVLLGLLMAHQAEGFPSLAGIVLNGGFTPTESVARLLDGTRSKLPVIATELGTFDAASVAGSVSGHISHTSQRKIDVALRLFEKYVDGPALLDAIDMPRPQVITPLMFEYDLLERAHDAEAHIVLPEGDDDRVLRAAGILLQREVVDLTILGVESRIRARAAELNVNLDAAVIRDPAHDRLHEEFAQQYASIRAHKGTTIEWARDTVASETYFGTMMVQMGYADGMVSGASHTTAQTIRPSFEIIRTADGVDNVSSVFLMCLKDRVLVYGDCAIFPDPDEKELADIAISSAQTALQFGIEPRIAMLSYSTGESGKGADVDKVRAATAIVRERCPDLLVEGPLQYDAAVSPSVARTKMPNSPVAGRATVLVFPDLNTGNNTYKAVQRSSGAVAIGPVLQGLRKPVNDLSRGALVQDIVNTVAITAIQAKGGPA